MKDQIYQRRITNFKNNLTRQSTLLIDAVRRQSQAEAILAIKNVFEGQELLSLAEQLIKESDEDYETLDLREDFKNPYQDKPKIYLHFELQQKVIDSLLAKNEELGQKTRSLEKENQGLKKNLKKLFLQFKKLASTITDKEGNTSDYNYNTNDLVNPDINLTKNKRLKNFIGFMGFNQNSSKINGSKYGQSNKFSRSSKDNKNKTLKDSKEFDLNMAQLNKKHYANSHKGIQLYKSPRNQDSSSMFKQSPESKANKNEKSAESKFNTIDELGDSQLSNIKAAVQAYGQNHACLTHNRQSLIEKATRHRHTRTNTNHDIKEILDSSAELKLNNKLILRSKTRNSIGHSNTDKKESINCSNKREFSRASALRTLNERSNNKNSPSKTSPNKAFKRIEDENGNARYQKSSIDRHSIAEKHHKISRPKTIKDYIKINKNIPKRKVVDPSSNIMKLPTKKNFSHVKNTAHTRNKLIEPKAPIQMKNNYTKFNKTIDYTNYSQISRKKLPTIPNQKESDNISRIIKNKDLENSYISEKLQSIKDLQRVLASSECKSSFKNVKFEDKKDPPDESSSTAKKKIGFDLIKSINKIQQSFKVIDFNM